MLTLLKSHLLNSVYGGSEERKKILHSSLLTLHSSLFLDEVHTALDLFEHGLGNA
jgi:hypothetical protein